MGLLRGGSARAGALVNKLRNKKLASGKYNLAKANTDLSPGLPDGAVLL